MSRNQLVIAGVIIIILILGGVFFFTSRETAPNGSVITPEKKIEAPTQTQSAPEPIKGVTITVTDAGFEPATVTVKTGTTVTFLNKRGVAVWPASALHPTHTVYPGSGIEKCGTAEQGNIFDACRGLNAGESWSFTFTHSGTWKYHDHLNVRHVGTIIVE